MDEIKNGCRSIVDIVNCFISSEYGESLLAEMEKQKADNPAQFEMRFSHKLTQEHMGAETHFSCALHRFQKLNLMREDWDSDTFDQCEFDHLYEEYHDHMLAAAKHIKAYRNHRKMLEKEVSKQEKRRKR